MNIFIYRPDRGLSENKMKIEPDLCYTNRGQNFRDWQKDQQSVYDYKIELIKRKLSKPKNSHYLPDFWR